MILTLDRLAFYRGDSVLCDIEDSVCLRCRDNELVALARKLLIALWHFIRDGVVPEGVILRPAH